MRRTRRILATAAATVAAAGSMLAFATPAQAETDFYRAYTADGDGFHAGAGSASFRGHGEVFTVCDHFSDGAGVITSWWRNGDYRGNMYNGKGAGTCREFNKSAAEGADIEFRVCLIDDGEVKDDTCIWVINLEA